MNKKMKTVEMNVFGIVQGVGFRWATIQAANRLGVSGWVQNQSDGSVKIVAQGPMETLNRFIKRIKASPTPYAKIHSVTINYITKTPLVGFNVKY